MTVATLPEKSITLRPYQADDESFLFKVYASTRDAELALVNWDQAQKDAFTHMQYKAQRQYYREHYSTATYHVIQYKEVDIGRIIIDRQSGQILLMDIAILPEYRNQGIGTSLIRELMLEAAQTCKPVRLQVEVFNPALHLYDRLGFIKVQEAGIYYEMEWSPGVI